MHDESDRDVMFKSDQDLIDKRKDVLDSDKNEDNINDPKRAKRSNIKTAYKNLNSKFSRQIINRPPKSTSRMNNSTLNLGSSANKNRFISEDSKGSNVSCDKRRKSSTSSRLKLEKFKLTNIGDGEPAKDALRQVLSCSPGKIPAYLIDQKTAQKISRKQKQSFTENKTDKKAGKTIEHKNVVSTICNFNARKYSDISRISTHLAATDDTRQLTRLNRLFPKIVNKNEASQKMQILTKNNNSTSPFD